MQKFSTPLEIVFIRKEQNAYISRDEGIIHARLFELFIIENGRAIAGAIRTKRAFLLPVDTIRHGIPKEVGGVKTNWDTRVEPCARPVGSINRVVRYISHPAVRSARIPTLYLRGVPRPNARGGHSMPPQSPPTDLHATGSCSYPTGSSPDSTLHQPARDTTTHYTRAGPDLPR